MLVRVVVPAPEGLSFVEGVRWANALDLAELEAPRPLSSTGAWVWTPGSGGAADTVTWASFFPDATAHPMLVAFEIFAAKARADWYVAGPGRRLRPGGGRGVVS